VTHLVQNWGKLGWVSAQLGHRDETVTIRRYFKFRPTAQTAGYADEIRITN
jgi:integrase